MTSLATLALLLVAAPTVPATPSIAEALDTGLATHVAGPARAVWATALLRGAPYGVSPLGEGRAPDPDPTFRLDRFDCTTLVETALALGASVTAREAAGRMDAIRYRGPPSFENRNHYVEAQWLPALAAAGWVEDVTVAIAGEAAVDITVSHTRSDWEAEARAGRLVAGLDPQALPAGVTRLPVVPLARVRALAARIPEGTIVLVAREPRTGRPSSVIHLGIVVAGPGGRRLVRHASSDAGKVIDESLDRFVARYERQRRWPVAGLGFLAMRVPGAGR